MSWRTHRCIVAAFELYFRGRDFRGRASGSIRQSDRATERQSERTKVKRRDLLVGFAAGVGFTAGNGYLWHLAEESAQSRPVSLREDLLKDGLSLDEDAFGLGDEDIVPASASSSSDTEKLVRARVADATRAPDLAELNGQLDLVPQSPAKTQADASNQAAEADPATAPDSQTDPAPTQTPQHDRLVLEKVRNFNGDFADDVYLSQAERPVLHSLFIRLKRAQRLVGHGNYNLLGFDQLFKYGRNYPEVGEFTPAELQLIEKLFFTEARKYGFYGKKVTKELTARIPAQEAVKIPQSGHYLFKGESTTYYKKLRRDIGDSVILTSGIRGNVKQTHLFVAKCLESNYNLSKASRSLAPPGHSYHGIGDFDVGRVGWGYSNFTDKFAETDEFKRMQDLGYVQIRYTKDNRYGVRFEPWHIKVV